MTNNVFKKGLVFGIIVLFVGANILPVVALDSNSKKNTIITINKNKEYNKGVSIKYIQLDFSTPQIINDGRYQRVTIKETDRYNLVSGEPIIPVYNTIMKFPLGTEIVDVKCIFSSFETMQLSKKISLAPSTISPDIRTKFIQQKINYDVYNSNEWYPSKWYSYHTGGGLNDGNHVTFLSIHVYPIRYLPRYNQIQYVKNVYIEVKYKEPSALVSFNDIYDLLIITPSEFFGNILPLVAHKNKYGISTKLITLDEIYSGSYFPVQGRDDAEKIKYFIKNAIENWNLSYIFLIGGCDKLPVRLVSSASSYSINTFISDLYYADIYSSDGSFCSWDSNNNGRFGEINRNGDIIDTMDLYPDLYIGRIPCTSSNEVDTVVNKIINYEIETYNQSWFKNLILCGGDTFNNLLVEWILGARASEGIYSCDKIASVMKDFNPIKLYANSIFNRKNLPLASNINNAINDGAGFVLFSGHGNPTLWVTHPPLLMFINLFYKSSDIANLNNNNKLPIMVFYACSNGDYSKETGIPSPIAWEFVKKEGGGAIATFATTTLAYSTMGKVCLARVSGYITLHLFQAYYSGYNKPGMMLSQAQTDYLNDNDAMQFHQVADYLTIEEWALFGDPSLKTGGIMNP